MARYWQAGDPLKMQASCDRRQAGLLVQFDHHLVVVQNRWGILITYPWMPVEAAPEPLMATVVFNPAPGYLPSEAQVRAAIRKHPVAPPEIQTIIDRLDFTLPSVA